MKKILTAALVFALALSVVAPVATSAQSMTNAFNTNLKLGARGADVVALQSFLESKGLLTMPAGVAKGFFGGLTKSAVVAYQISKGVTPASGYFGPLTRATANADTTSTTTTTTTTTTTGTTGTTVTTSGVEGTVDVLLAPTPTNNANVQTSTDVPVLGVEFRGKIADSAVQTLDIRVSSTLPDSSTENPSTLINTIKVWDGSTVIATIPVNSSTFTKDSSNVYYVRVSGLNAVVSKDTTKTLVVSFSTNSIDTERTVVVSGYGTNSVRTVSGNGISSFYNISGLSRQHTFKKPGTSTLTLSAVSSPLRSQNYRVNSTDTTVAPVLNVNVKSETGDSKITDVTATSTLSGVVASNLVYYLYDGSTLVDSKTGTSTVTFSNLSVNVAKDVTKTLTVKIGFPATTTGAYVATTSVTSVTYEKPNSSSATVSTAVNGVAQYVYTKAPMMTLASAPTLTAVQATIAGASSTLSANFNININPQGGDWARSSATGLIGWYLASAPSVEIASTTVALNRVDNIADNSSATVGFSAVISSSDAAIQAGANQYIAKIKSLTWNVGGVTVAQTYGYEDFITNIATLTK